jgi:1,4-alpha-glucan branching enzyme
MWLNETNEWIYPHVHAAQQRMTELVRRFPQPTPLQERALRQAGRELLLAQASDWAFILRSGTSPDYARTRVKDHLGRFTHLYEGISNSQLDEAWLTQVEMRDNIFPELNYRYWE